MENVRWLQHIWKFGRVSCDFNAFCNCGARIDFAIGARRLQWLVFVWWGDGDSE